MNTTSLNKSILHQKKQELDFLHHFHGLGYDLIDLSAIEKFDWTTLSSDDLGLMTERHKWQHEGALYALRSDWTNAIVRYRQKYQLHSETIAYSGPIYTLTTEKHQYGLETFTGDVNKQMAVLKQMVNYIKDTLTLPLSVAVISHNTLLKNLLSETELNDALTRKYIQERNRDALKAKLGEEHPIIDLMAQPAAEQANYVKTNMPHLKRHIEEMNHWEKILIEEKVSYVYGDMLALPSQSYYKGISIQLYAEDQVEPIASGGQYSSPSNAFGIGLNI
ncbi:ATP phosphoribosyltransferase regulatory subunit [Marinilactibacillus kalidii]|uniref:ATP phosphoribosyltransferase regulatory subunit n=1 Tax=Marinilactibacillus kalidii TaxID=2820274 RepID=UPI001ABDC5F2|nr:ATP phosphoribosyltransferase regulatory subunit [Marinilactibacillus kalidii]